MSLSKQDMTECHGKPLPRVIVGLGYGDEGKGMATCFEAKQLIDGYGLKPFVVRYNGGPQAAHNVRVKRMGKVLHHTHQQIGSGGLLMASTILSDGMLVDPVSIIPEAELLSKEANDPYAISRITIDTNAPMVLPLHAMVNRALEKRRGTKRHGSTGRGIGVARACENAWRHDNGIDGEPLTVSLLGNQCRLANALAWWNGWLERRFGIELGLDAIWYDEQATMLNTLYRRMQSLGIRFVDDTTGIVRNLIDDEYSGVVFEGSQGIMLDERYGWFPNVTYGDMTQANARRIAGADHCLVTQGVIRTYSTRHGYGPFPPEGTFDVAEPDNGTGQWQGAFRTGVFDMPTFVKACEVVRPDELAITHMDVTAGRYVSAWKRHEAITHVGADGSDISVKVPSEPVISEYSDNMAFADAIARNANALARVSGYGDTIDDWQRVA
jgi:adenylosuccinate synthase